MRWPGGRRGRAVDPFHAVTMGAIASRGDETCAERVAEYSGMSRAMVDKTLRAMARLGYLAVGDDGLTYYVVDPLDRWRRPPRGAGSVAR